MFPDPLELIDHWGPEKVVLVSDRKSGMRGVLVIDNTARGLGKGGTRMSPTLTLDEVSRLARTMTWKWAAVDLFHGGAKAGILGDPRAGDKERLLRAFARALAKEVPSDYVFGLDMGLAEEDAAILVDELNDRGVSTGLPSVLGGLPYDRLGVTGYGVAEATDAAAAVLEILQERGVAVVPDFIANAGGIVAAAHSTDAGSSPFTVDPGRVLAMISEKLRANTVRVLTDGRDRRITPRTAAMDLAQARVLAAMTARGFRPEVPHTGRRRRLAA